MKVRLESSPGATRFEKRLMALDLAATPPPDVVVARSDEVDEADIRFVYGAPEKLQSSRKEIVVSTRPPERKRTLWPFRRGAIPDAVIATEVPPEEESERLFLVPEAVDPDFADAASADSLTVVWVDRPSVTGIVSAVRTRVERFREDISWKSLPVDFTAESFGTGGVFFDPATEEEDCEGGLAQAMVAGYPVVATRTAINRARTMNGRAGLLVPLDPNEIVHALLTQLFKPEETRHLLEESNRQIGRFDPLHRFGYLVETWRALL